MKRILWVAVSVALAIVACDNSDPMSTSPDEVNVVSGTVVSDQTGSPVPGVTVDFEHHRGGMMMDGDWNGFEHMVTDDHGRFHFEYTHQSMYHYRVMVHGATDPRGMCYLDDELEGDIVLRVP